MKNVDKFKAVFSLYATELWAMPEGEFLKWLNSESTETERQWIPCSRRLPDDLAEVNVTYVNHDPEPYYVFTKDKPYTASAVYYKGNWYWYSSTCADYLGEYGRNDVDKVDDAIEITAWKPLPEPYRGEQNED